MVLMAEAQGYDVTTAVATVGPYQRTTYTGCNDDGNVAFRNMVFARADGGRRSSLSTMTATERMSGRSARVMWRWRQGCRAG
jgi:hypothetical protein